MLAPERKPTAIIYAVAAASVGGAATFRYLLHDTLEEHLAFSFFYLAVVLTAWVGGVWPALATACVSAAIANYYFTQPSGSLEIQNLEELFGLLLFVGVSLVIGVLSESSLRALERARAAEQAKDEFMATVAHELRSPLSVIHYANALSRLAPGKPNEQIDLIDRQVRHLDVLIRDLLDVSRVTRGKIHLEFHKIDARTVVRSAIERARPLIDNHGHTLVVNLTSQPLPIYGDQVRLEQVLSNLLTNASKYTPDGGEICVSAQPAGDFVEFTIRDNGIGISEELLPKVFDLFVQADGTSDRAEGGLGIGLALVKKLVEMHDGSVQAYSNGPGSGSEFVVSLPLASAALVTAELIEV